MKNLLPWTLLLLSANAQNITTDLSTYFNATTFPKQQWKNVSSLLSQGLEIAGADVGPHFMHRCIRAQVYPKISDGGQPDEFVPPNSPFKNVYYVGQAAWQAWAIDTGNRELLLIDTLASPEEAEHIIVPGVEKFGFSGSDIKHIVITHEHTDHFGGLAYLQKHFNSTVYASETAWIAMAASKFNPPLYHNYTNARAVNDSETITINNFTLKTFLTPGHTPGTISLRFPVTDNSTQTSHTAGFYGGGGIPSSVSAMSQQINSFNRWSKLSRDAGVDVLMSNHQSQDNAILNFDILDHRDCGAGKCNMPNPFIVGVDFYARYAQVMALCVGVMAARDGFSLQGVETGKRDVDVTEEACQD